MLKNVIQPALFFMAVVSAGALIYAFVAPEPFRITPVFTANFVVGLMIIVGGLLNLAKPTMLILKKRKSRLIDHTTFSSRVMKEKELKYGEALQLIWVGIFITSAAAIAQYIAWLLF